MNYICKLFPRVRISPMFYETKLDNELRFGDVFEGHIFSSLVLNSTNTNSYNNFDINFIKPDFCVLLTPCCNVMKVDYLSFVPLNKIHLSLFSNKYFRSDLLIINTQIEAEKHIPDTQWDHMEESKKIEIRGRKELEYPLKNLFVYPPAKGFKSYDVATKDNGIINTSYYVIDFQNISQINFSKIKSIDNHLLLKSKRFQLKISVRNALREKMADYFCRVPVEDKI